MSNLVMWNLIVGFLMPNLVAVIQQPRYTTKVRSLITFAAALVGGFGTAYFTDRFNFGDIIGSVLVTGVSAITFYKGFWKPSGVAVAIENATSKTPPTVEQAHPSDTDAAYLPQHARDDSGQTDTRTMAIIALVLVVLVIVVLLL